MGLPDHCAIVADPRFARVRARDASADGQFVYAVRTTGVFCRPSCPARPANPVNMAFFATAAEAAAAGFRACKRCRPEGDDAAIVARMRVVAEHIARHADQTLPLADLAAVAGLSPFHLQRTFKRVIGVSPKAFQAGRRLEAFKAALRAGEPVLGAVFGAGYGSTSRVYEAIDGNLGMTPSAYRAGGAGETIVFAVRPTALGMLMMAATGRGVCAVAFGQTAEALEGGLAAEFFAAKLVPAGLDAQAPLAAWIAALEVHLSAGGPRPELPLDLRGTAFQMRVWRFLVGTRPGEVVTYGEVARAIGAPRAARAAASACAANRIAVLVPCHRALRGDGGLGGYRWGVERKRALVEGERGR